MAAVPILVLNGVFSAGKSSLAAALLAALDPPYAYGAMDQFEGMVGNLWRAPGADRLYRTARFAAAGLGVVVDTVLTDPGWLRDMAIQFAAHPAALIGVRCELPELERRERARGDRSLGKARAQLALVHPMVEARGGYDLAVDTTTARPEDVVHQIIKWLASGTEPGALRRWRDAGCASSRPPIGCKFGWVAMLPLRPLSGKIPARISLPAARKRRHGTDRARRFLRPPGVGASASALVAAAPLRDLRATRRRRLPGLRAAPVRRLPRHGRAPGVLRGRASRSGGGRLMKARQVAQATLVGGERTHPAAAPGRERP